MKWDVYRTFYIQVEAGDRETANEIASDIEMRDWDFLSQDVRSIGDS